MAEPDIDNVVNSRESAFRALVELVRHWRSEGRVTTTAGLKPAFDQATQITDLAGLGFDTFLQLVEAAEADRWVKIGRTPSGHRLLLLPDEEVATVPATRTEALSNVAREVEDGASIRPDVWAAFVDWRHERNRYWDRREGRALSFPSGSEMEIGNDPSQRYVAITPIAMSTQIGWMQAFASQLPNDQRSLVEASLGDNAAPGSFKSQLTELGLVSQWRKALRGHVADEIANWAEGSGVRWTSLILRGVRSRGAHAKVPSSSFERDLVTRYAGASDEERLRSVLHRVIDRMPLHELSAIPIRAEYLLIES